jgi:hypothetical protein
MRVKEQIRTFIVENCTGHRLVGKTKHPKSENGTPEKSLKLAWPQTGPTSGKFLVNRDHYSLCGNV